MQCLVCTGHETQYFFIPQGTADIRNYFGCSRSTHRGENSCEKSESYLRASRLTPGIVGVKARTNRALASQISNPLNSWVLPCSLRFPSVPNKSRFSSASNVSWTDAAYDDLLEPIPSPPLSSVLGEIKFWRNLLFESDCSLAAATLNPGLLKHGKIVDTKHLHFSLAHAHASVLQATGRQHNFRLTRKLVSYSACSIAKGNRCQVHVSRRRAPRSQWSWYTSTPWALSPHLSGDRGSTLCSWAAPLASSLPTAPTTRVRPPSSPS